ncbi:type IX secretion system membrane protein PorP/SprF [Pelobium sp.]|nr:type IX secretion system membrane protein PorP/SprF [Pelobium sp.]MDA9555720.1 type IX secretion system membrane protein PorP/SprF [Pelobium sp.]
MKKYNYLIIGFIFLISITQESNAQQNAMYTQYMFNSLAINPAYAGSRNVISATALYRNQWTGIDGAPKTTTFTIDAPINENRIGLGLQVFNDKLGITNTTGAVVSAAYRIRMDEATLSFGVQGGISNFKADFRSVSLDENGTSTDPAFQENVNALQFNVGTGVYYNTDKFYFGVSVPTLVPNRLSKGSTAITNNPSKQEMHFFISAGYVFDVGNDFKFKPSFLVKGVKGAPIEGDINATFWIKDIIGLGAQYRTNADVAGLLEFQINPQIRLGYSYDYSTTKLANFNNGSHEFMLRYEFGFEKNKVVSPRYF